MNKSYGLNRCPESKIICLLTYVPSFAEIMTKKQTPLLSRLRVLPALKFGGRSSVLTLTTIFIVLRDHDGLPTKPSLVGAMNLSILILFAHCFFLLDGLFSLGELVCNI